MKTTRLARLIVSVLSLWFVVSATAQDAQDLSLKEIDSVFIGEDEALLHSPAIPPLRNSTLDADSLSQDSELKINSPSRDNTSVPSSPKISLDEPSQISWGRINHKSFLDYQLWAEERLIREGNKDWAFYLKRIGHHEKIGEVLQCVGDCKLYRGQHPVKAQPRTQIYESDDVTTGENSYLWVLLMDGTLVRLYPVSSVSFYEINWSHQNVFMHVRLNSGFISWLVRGHESDLSAPMENQTNAIDLPFPIKEANIEHYERVYYQELDEIKKRSFLMGKELQPLTIMQDQLKVMLKSHQEKWSLPEQKLLFVTPLGSLLNINKSFHAYYEPFFPFYFKLHSEKGSSKFQGRSLSFVELNDVESKDWLKTEDGKNLIDVVETQALDWTLFSIKRTPSLYLARELHLQRWDQFLIHLKDLEKLKSEFKVLTWEQAQLDERQKFLQDYTRRQETLLLSSRDKLKHLETVHQDELQKGIDERFYFLALEKYRASLKTVDEPKRQSIKEMNDWQFYGWLLKNAKN